MISDHPRREVFVEETGFGLESIGPDSHGRFYTGVIRPLISVVPDPKTVCLVKSRAAFAPLSLSRLGDYHCLHPGRGLFSIMFLGKRSRPMRKTNQSIQSAEPRRATRKRAPLPEALKAVNLDAAEINAGAAYVFELTPPLTTVTVPIVNDLAREANENVLLRLSNPVNATIGSPFEHALTLEDDEPPLAAKDWALYQ